MKLKDKLAVISIWAPNVAQAAHFYRDVLGLNLLAHAPGGRPHFLVGETPLVILQGEPRQALNTTPERFPLIAFEVDGIGETEQTLAGHQIEMPWGVEEDADSKWIMFHDPAGNLLEIAEFR